MVRDAAGNVMTAAQLNQQVAQSRRGARGDGLTKFQRAMMNARKPPTTDRPQAPAGPTTRPRPTSAGPGPVQVPIEPKPLPGTAVPRGLPPAGPTTKPKELTARVPMKPTGPVVSPIQAAQQLGLQKL